jgi:signal transduction histidine kinase
MKPLRIAITEDDLIIAEHLKELLIRSGHQVTMVWATGEETLAAAEKDLPDLFLLDIALGGALDGIQTAAAVWERFRRPFMFLSAFSDQTLLQKAVSTRPFGYLVKPVSDRQLQISIEMAFYRFEVEVALQEAQENLERKVAERTQDLVAANASVHHEMEERRRLERLINDVVEDERRRLGADLHDGLGQILTGISLRGLALQQDLEQEESPLAEHAFQIVALANSASQKARQVSQLLFPVGLLNRGLRLALEELVAHASSHPHLDCRLDFDDSLDQLFPENTRIAIYRITQEALTNARRHGRPKVIMVRCCREEAQCLLEVWNDGTTMEIESGEACKGMGVEIMKHRAMMIGATLVLENAPGGGVRMQCRLPLAGVAGPANPTESRT